MIDAAGEERFARFPAEPGCEARTGGGDESATIAGFIESQDALPYLEWTRRYSDLYKRMIGILRRAGQTRAAEGIPEGEAQESGKRLGKARDESEEPRSPLSSWQDIDVSLAEYCSARGLDVPEEVEEAIDLHIRAMEEWLDGLEATLPREGEG